jgi:hypothetical protein
MITQTLSEEDEVTITSYSLEEIVIEKMAALMGRTFHVIYMILST